MDVERRATPAEFLAATANYRDGEPLRTNLHGTIAAAVASGARHYEECWWWVVRERGAVVGIAVRTAPFVLQIGPMPREGARSLARAVARDDADLPGAAGSTTLVEAFLEDFATFGSAGAPRRASAHHRTLLYELGDLRVPDVEGTLRRATTEDLELVH